jgi:hypothetical protein
LAFQYYLVDFAEGVSEATSRKKKKNKKKKKKKEKEKKEKRKRLCPGCEEDSKVCVCEEEDAPAPPPPHRQATMTELFPARPSTPSQPRPSAEFMSLGQHVIRGPGSRHAACAWRTGL